jgi:hypothetical protein
MKQIFQILWCPLFGIHRDISGTGAYSCNRRTLHAPFCGSFSWWFPSVDETQSFSTLLWWSSKSRSLKTEVMTFLVLTICFNFLEGGKSRISIVCFVTQIQVQSDESRSYTGSQTAWRNTLDQFGNKAIVSLKFPIWQSGNTWSGIDILGTHRVCKTNTLTILMHQMRISTTQVSWKSGGGCENWKSRRKKTRVPWNWAKPSKDRAMPEGDNPSFWDECTKFTFFLTVQFILVF